MIITFVYPSPSHITGGIRVNYEFANHLSRRGHEVHFVHGPAWPDRIAALDELPSFPFDPAVQHHIVDSLDDHTLPDGDVAFALGAPARLGLPVVFVQGYKMLPAALEEATFRTRAPKVCIASWLVQVGLDLGVPKQQLWHVPLGMDHDLFAARTPANERPTDVAMLFNPHREKGWDVGLQVLEQVRIRHPQARLLVFGQFAPTTDLPDAVEFLVDVSQETLAERVYNASKIFVQPSHHEGFGYTAVEAMACGCALVTTDNGGSRDYAIHDETAWVVLRGDTRGLVQGVDQLLRDESQRAALSHAGARFVRRFDWDVAAARLESRLEEYVADPLHFQQPSASALGRERAEELRREYSKYLARPMSHEWRTSVRESEEQSP